MTSSSADCRSCGGFGNPDIIVAESAGFCSGVQRAMNIAISAAEKHGKAYTLGELVHNDDAIRILEKCGVTAVSLDEVQSLPAKSAVIIRSHGVGRTTYGMLAAAGVTVYDATCPYVKKIHGLVENVKEADDEGRKCAVVIIGDESHPEVQGIVGHVSDFLKENGGCFVANSPQELETLLKSHKTICHNALIFVTQTTFNEQKWRKCRQTINTLLTSQDKYVTMYDTICSATIKRQKEAEELSRRVDVMLVIGSNRSSNSLKLYEICKASCRDTFFISGTKDLQNLPRNASAAAVKIGITAGASVPEEIIKEVHRFMNKKSKDFKDYDIETSSNEYEGYEDGFDFMAEVDKTFHKVHTGKRVRAYVVAVNDNEVVVDLGTKHSGYIPADEFGGEPGKKLEELVKAGDELDCIVTKINDVEGIVYLSKKRIESEVGYSKLMAAYEADEVVEGIVDRTVNGGVIVAYEGARVFIPASQSGVPRNGKLEVLLKKQVKFKVIEINESRKRLIGSIRAASRLENDVSREKFWAEIELGKKFTGEIKSIENYGVFVDLGGVDGMVHLSELTWKRIRHPKDAVSLGDKLEVIVKSYDPERRRVSLTAKNPDENPWTKFVEDYEIGMATTATVVNLTQFGAFAQIIPGIDGLIHISQICANRVEDVSKALSVGQVVDVKITDIDEENERVSISIKALLEDNAEAEEDGDAAEAVEVAEAAAEATEIVEPTEAAE